MRFKAAFLGLSLLVSHAAMAHQLRVVVSCAGYVGNEVAFKFMKDGVISCLFQDISFEGAIQNITDVGATVKVAGVDPEGKVLSNFAITAEWDEEVRFTFERSPGVLVQFVFQLVHRIEEDLETE